VLRGALVLSAPPITHTKLVVGVPKYAADTNPGTTESARLSPAAHARERFALALGVMRRILRMFLAARECWTW
jgi:hypothetical protein